MNDEAQRRADPVDPADPALGAEAAAVASAAHFRRQGRNIFIAWAVLIALLLTSVASAFVPLGAWNAALGLAIATLKTAIVLWWFMHLSRAGALLRTVAAAGLFTLLVLFGLSELDDLTRPEAPAVMQPARQVGDWHARRPP
jgi:cytochrome c oxidase subunit 4